MSRNELVMPPELARAFGEGDPFDTVMKLQGEVFRDVPGRRTLRFSLGGKSYFAKLHFGVGWGEILKNLLTLRRPILSAATEWQAIRKVQSIGIATTPPVAYGCRGSNPARQRSFLITEDLGDIVSLEDFCRDWMDTPPPARLKRKLIIAVAELASRLHRNGINHRDFYLCHFCLDRSKLKDGEIRLILIDLHRAQVRPATPRRWRDKDLAGLYFSALNIGLDQRDRLRFLRHYFGQPLGKILQEQRQLLDWLASESARLMRKFERKYGGGA